MNITLMKTLLQMNPQNLFDYVHLFLKSKYPEKNIKASKEKQWIFAKGNCEPVLLCAHLDTVFEKPPINIFIDKEQEVMWSPAGLGSDDRAGVYAIFDILMSGCCPSVLFTMDEEIGCLGACDLIQHFPKCPFDDIKMIIQLDRRNQREAVYYGCANIQFEKWITSFGFEKEFGTFTDITVICPNWKIAGVNLSVGYYNEHTPQEFLRYNQLMDTIERVKRILYSATSRRVPRFEFIPERDSVYDKIVYAKNTCDFCSTPLWGDIFYKIKDAGFTYTLCSRCADYYKNKIDPLPFS